MADLSEFPSRIRYKDDGVTREGKILNIAEITTRNDEGTRELTFSRRIYIHVTAFLAWKHFRERNDSVLPWLSERTKDCRFDLHLENRDTNMSPKHAVYGFVNATTGAAETRND